MSYTVKSSEKLRKTGAETETKALSLIHMPTVQNGQPTRQTIGTSAPAEIRRM